MLYQIADEFYPMLAEKDLTLSTELEENLILYADADKLARVMDNLLRNAVNYSYPSTDIRLTAAREGDAVRIMVSNAGIPSLTPNSAGCLKSFSGWIPPGRAAPAARGWGWPSPSRSWSCTTAPSPPRAAPNAPSSPSGCRQHRRMAGRRDNSAEVLNDPLTEG